MSRNGWCAIVVAIGSLVGSSQAHAQAEWGCDVEMLFLKLNTAIGYGTDNRANNDPAPRFTFSRTAEDGLGFRVIYFEFDHTNTDPRPGGIRTAILDTYNIDFEVFQRLYMTERVSAEMSGGLRYNDTTFSYPTRFEPADFTGVGAILGIRGDVRVFENGGLYARTKFALLAGDGGHDANGLTSPNAPKNFDMGRSQIEVAIGYQHTFEVGRFQIVPRVGLEYQNWMAFVPDVVDEHPETNFMLSGFAAGLGIYF